MKDHIIVALDVTSEKQGVELIDCLDEAGIFKIGLIPFLEFGDMLIATLRKKHKRLFLDLKFKDIPNTVFGAVRSSLKYDPAFLTIHLSGGAEMIRQAVAAVGESQDTVLLGVTVLTSLSDADLKETGMGLSSRDAVLRLCELGLNNGVRAMVCSPQEIIPIRERFGKDLTLVTPGIRPEWSAKGDQKRVFTPRMAIQAGSDYLVIGRPITASENPGSAWQRILAEIEP